MKLRTQLIVLVSLLIFMILCSVFLIKSQSWLLVIAGVVMGMVISLIISKFKNDDPEVLAQIAKGRTEFGKLSQTLKASLTENEDLMKEVAARKEREELIRKSEIKFRHLLDSLPVRVFYKDKNSVFSACNKAFAQDLNASITDIIGKTDYDFCLKELADKYRADDKRILESGKVQELEERYIADGKDMIVQTIKTPVRNEEGEITGILVILWDITERKQAEDALQTMHKALEDAHKQLKESMAQLVQAEKLTALGELTSGIAHELNQPLNVTKIICQGILRDIQKGRYSETEAKTDLPQIVLQMDKLAAIITHMRIFTRQTDGMLQEKQDINGILNNVLKFLRQQYKDHNVHVIENFAVGLPLVKVDSIRIEQVCLNLLTNARYSVENSGKVARKIEIKTYYDDRQNMVIFEVADNGTGLNAEQRNKLFQPFFTTKAPGSGTGLGLSVSKKIIEEHNGRIEECGQEGEGAVFRVFLPAVQ
ncbi:MAG: PAS domain-containing protein [Candidatus Omnitrophica bacterium]|nr:PAS domain-containing protein [Candidatus Omnitrophota bacterium]